MKRQWTDEELEADFTLHPAELDLIGDSKTDRTLLGFAVLLKYFQYEGRFPSQKQDIPPAVTLHLAHQLGIAQEHGLVAKPFRVQGLEDIAPFLVAGNPGELVVVWEQPSVAGTSKPLARSILTSTNRVIWTQVHLNQIVTEESQDRDTLLHGGVREPSARGDGEDGASFGIGTSGRVFCIA